MTSQVSVSSCIPSLEKTSGCIFIVVSIDFCRAFSFSQVLVFLPFCAVRMFSACRTSAGFEYPDEAALFPSASHRSA